MSTGICIVSLGHLRPILFFIIIITTSINRGHTWNEEKRIYNGSPWTLVKYKLSLPLNLHLNTFNPLVCYSKWWQKGNYLVYQHVNGPLTFLYRLVSASKSNMLTVYAPGHNCCKSSVEKRNVPHLSNIINKCKEHQHVNRVIWTILQHSSIINRIPVYQIYYFIKSRRWRVPSQAASSSSSHTGTTKRCWGGEVAVLFCYVEEQNSTSNRVSCQWIKVRY